MDMHSLIHSFTHSLIHSFTQTTMSKRKAPSVPKAEAKAPAAAAAAAATSTTKKQKTKQDDSLGFSLTDLHDAFTQVDKKKKTTTEEELAAAASSSSSAVAHAAAAAAAVGSLDPDDPTPVAPLNEESIKWFVQAPAEYSDLEIVQADIGAGIRLPVVDIVRLNSLVLTTLVELARKENSSRIYIPNGLFKSPVIFHLFWNLVCGVASKSSEVTVDNANFIELLHGANALAAMKTACMVNIMTKMKTEPCSAIRGDQLVLAGSTYHEPILIKKGARHVATEIEASAQHTYRLRPWQAGQTTEKREVELDKIRAKELSTLDGTLVNKCAVYWVPDCACTADVQAQVTNFRQQLRTSGRSLNNAYTEAIEFAKTVMGMFE